ncbi:hypothetical protein ZWY2020_035878 [Hordeum vulgare]|nr:hypothetical protein ZWY2020_035878 [Hordeum vulgare]
MRPLFVGNLDYDTRHSELDHLFYRYGRIQRIDMKSEKDERPVIKDAVPNVFRDTCPRKSGLVNGEELLIQKYTLKRPRSPDDDHGLAIGNYEV